METIPSSKDHRNKTISEGALICAVFFNMKCERSEGLFKFLNSRKFFSYIKNIKLNFIHYTGYPVGGLGIVSNILKKWKLSDQSVLEVLLLIIIPSSFKGVSREPLYFDKSEWASMVSRFCFLINIVLRTFNDFRGKHNLWFINGIYHNLKLLLLLFLLP